jgi:uncharacterized membrane protein
MKNISTGIGQSLLAWAPRVLPRHYLMLGCVFSAMVCPPSSGEWILDMNAPGPVFRVTNEGTVISGGPSGWWRWTASDGLQLLPYPKDLSVSSTSDDGRYAVGLADDGLTYRWSLEEGAMQIGPLGFVGQGISGNGKVVFGRLHDRPARWDGIAGVQELEVLPAEILPGGHAVDCSFDGSVIVGSCRASDGGFRAVRWASGSLTELPFGNYFAQSYAVSADGSTIVGYSCSPCIAFRWRASWSSSQPLGWGGVATDVSADGSVVAGGGGNYPYEGGIIWQSRIGTVMLIQHLASRGVDVSGWVDTNGAYRLPGVSAVSANGRFVVGPGYLADIGEFPVPTPTCIDADLFRDFNVNGADLGILLSQWGAATPQTVSDLNFDGMVDGADLGVLLSFWGPCPN